ncbi:hypothetical protein GCM10018785_16800 [Streptomyces longispororuber]|uniref:Iron-binding zinc finger CDGSH type domain-containing protein n=1 Tax=Streptomyces longispororuber TaxID=68230 RepID=A0A918ZEW0_9ACTN|nr:hypothetical protein GCM10018785_16800 [Streptomyces longispororuber]
MPNSAEPRHAPDRAPCPAAAAPVPAPAPTQDARRVTVDPAGPLLVEGPVEVVTADGSLVRSDRFVVAVCACRRTRTPPWCDTSHRRRTKGSPAAEGGPRPAGPGNRTSSPEPAGSPAAGPAPAPAPKGPYDSKDQHRSKDRHRSKDAKDAT